VRINYKVDVNLTQMKLHWIDKLRRQRIREARQKYGPWTVANFKKTGRSPSAEGTLELIDFINYEKMAVDAEEIRQWMYIKHSAMVREIIHDLDVLASVQKKLNR